MKFFQLVPTGTNFDFIGKFRIFMTLSILLNIASLVGVITYGLNYGIDFTGGTVMQVKFAQPIPAHEVRTTVEKLGDPEASVVSMGTDNREYLVTSRIHGDLKDAAPLHKRLVEKVGADKVSILQADIVGPKVGAELKASAVKSLFYSVLLIMIYIWFRFDFRFAPGATAAMIHDIALVTGFYLISGREFTITSIAALLTIAGYSVNDTIVVYDRVREILKAGGDGLPLAQVINNAVNLTLSRTLLTSGVTFISIIPIAIFCSGEIQSFAIAMMVGIFVGTYSTIYIASPLTIYVEHYFINKGKKSGTRPNPAPAKA